MSKFLFRLQRVLELRAQQEQSLAESLARALDRETEAREAEKSLHAVRRASSEQFAAAHSRSVTAGQLQNIGFLIEQLDQYVTIASGAADDAAAQADAAREQLVVAHQARRTLDRLRDRKHDEWTQAENRHDQQESDSFALTQFAMANSPLSSNR